MYLFLAYSQANQTNALYGLATQQPKLFLHSILHYVLEWWHEQVVVRHKLLLRRVSYWGNGCHHLLQDKFGALLDQLEREEEDACNSGWAISPPPPQNRQMTYNIYISCKMLISSWIPGENKSVGGKYSGVKMSSTEDKVELLVVRRILCF